MNEALTRTSVERLIEVPAANGGVPGTKSLDVDGNAFYLVDCTGEVEAKTDLNPFKTYRKSTGEEFPREQTFRYLEFRNTGAVPVTVRVWAGWGRYIDRRFEMVEAVTKAAGWDATQEIPANDFVAFAPQVGNGVISRKAIIITNLDANENLQIQDADGFTFMTVFPRSSVTLPVSDTIRVVNATGSAIACNVGQINYVEGNLITTAS